jgi:K+/H+ antiporter YhaU regulatory subunit KhtT
MAKLAPGLRLEEIEVRTGSPLAGKGVGETRARHPDAQILALKRSGDAHIAVPDHDTYDLDDRGRDVLMTPWLRP